MTNDQFTVFLNALLADGAHDVRLVGRAAPGTADARGILGRDAVLLMENLGPPSDRTLVALNDAESRIGVGCDRLVAQPGYERHPVKEVTWQIARRFFAWRGTRLPTEAEWEGAARGRERRISP